MSCCFLCVKFSVPAAMVKGWWERQDFQNRAVNFVMSKWNIIKNLTPLLIQWIHLVSTLLLDLNIEIAPFPALKTMETPHDPCQHRGALRIFSTSTFLWIRPYSHNHSPYSPHSPSPPKPQSWPQSTNMLSLNLTRRCSRSPWSKLTRRSQRSWSWRSNVKESQSSWL